MIVMKLQSAFMIFMAIFCASNLFLLIETAEAKTTDIVKSGKDTFKLQTKVKKAKTINTNLGRDRDNEMLEITYSRNNKNIACKGLSAADFQGCKMSLLTATPIELNEQFIGWRIAYPYACGGNRYYAKTLVIQVRWPLAKNPSQECQLHMITSKMEVAVDSVKSFMRIWYTSEKGSGASEYYPTLVMLLPLGDEQPTSNKNLPTNFNNWPKFEYSSHNYFPEVYMSGYLDRNDEVMIDAAQRLFKLTEVDTYKNLKLPTTQKEAIDAAKAVKLLDDIGML